MKNLKSVLVICLFVLNGCAVSDKVWGPKTYDEKFKGFAVADDQKRVVLLEQVFRASGVETVLW